MHSQKQGKSEGFDSCDRPSNLAQIWSKSLIFQPLWPWNLMDDLEKLQGTSSILHQALSIISNPSVNSNLSYSLETINLGQNWQFFVPCDLEIWWMTLENNGAPLLYYIKLCASFQSHGPIKTRVTVRKRSIRVNSNWSYSLETLNSGQNRRFFVPCDLEIWRMILKNNRAPLLRYLELCASFHSHQLIQTGDTVRKRPILVNMTMNMRSWIWIIFMITNIVVWIMILCNRTA